MSVIPDNENVQRDRKTVSADDAARPEQLHHDRENRHLAVFASILLLILSAWLALLGYGIGWLYFLLR